VLATPAAPPGVANTLPTEAPAVRRPATGLGRDNLQRIHPITAEVEKLLNVQGISRYEQIAGWGPADVARFDRLLGQAGRIARENWIDQAQILARHGETAYSRDFDRRGAEPAAEPPRPARLADAIRMVAGKSEGNVARATQAGASTVGEPRADKAGVAATATSTPQGETAAGADRAPRRDDLKRIRGVGAFIETKLNALGVTSYEQIASWSQPEIDRISRVLDLTGRIEREKWVDQARILLAGGQTEFSRRIDRGEIKGEPSKS
jgi:predicted flap endonuclease-1-like 5' DNA nuclease